MKKTLYNALVFNIAWLACVLGGSVVALPVTLLVIAVHLKFFSTRIQEALLIAIIIVVGLVVDSLLLRTGLLIAPDKSLWPPLWLVCLWGLFATTMNHSLRWFQSHLIASVVMGGIAGTLTYVAGTRLTDFSLKAPLPFTLMAIVVLWSIVFPLCLYITRRVLPDKQSF